MVISASLQAWGVVFPFAMLTSICRSIVTICSGLYLLIGMTRFSSKWILSHSTWYKSRRSGQYPLPDYSIVLLGLAAHSRLGTEELPVNGQSSLDRALLPELCLPGRSYPRLEGGNSRPERLL